MILLLILLLQIDPLPVMSRTPGATNPDVTQANIKKTICVPGWTKTVRPTSTFTDRLKIEQMKEYGLKGKTADYEEDHLISLELGGAPTNPLNLWPEAYEPKPGAREKDQVEDYLHRQVCAGKMKLADAQKAISNNWLKVYNEIQGAKKK